MMPDMLDYYADSIAREMTDKHPDVQRIRQEMRAKVGQAMQECRTMGQRQNRSSADRYPMPAIKVVDPTPRPTKRGR